MKIHVVLLKNKDGSKHHKQCQSFSTDHLGGATCVVAVKTFWEFGVEIYIKLSLLRMCYF